MSNQLKSKKIVWYVVYNCNNAFDSFINNQFTSKKALIKWLDNNYTIQQVNRAITYNEILKDNQGNKYQIVVL